MIVVSSNVTFLRLMNMNCANTAIGDDVISVLVPRSVYSAI